MIKEIAFTAYPAKDVASLRAWYEDRLGIRFNRPFIQDGVEKYSEAGIGNGYFSLMTTDWVERDPGSASGIVFEVENMDDAVTRLRKKGVRVEDPYDTGFCRIASLEDPEGNKVSLHQTTAPH